jgi:CRISPR-associated endoribonuclease Cas6
MNSKLYSVVLELIATNTAIIGAAMGHQAHALFLDLVRQVDPALSAQIHDGKLPNGREYRPFTVSPLQGGNLEDGGRAVMIKEGTTCRMRFTLLDGGAIWQALSHYFLENPTTELRLGAASFRLHRLLSTPAADPTGRAGYTEWQTLASASVVAKLTATDADRLAPTLGSNRKTTHSHSSQIRLNFASPTAFHHSGTIILFPQPEEVWKSLCRVWNNYAPDVLHLDREELLAFVKEKVVVTDHELRTTTLRFPTAPQKGFVGSCTYQIRDISHHLARPVLALAEFARYGGVGHKTTQGMGQTFPAREAQPPWIDGFQR